MALLETARRCEMYGVKLHPAKVLLLEELRRFAGVSFPVAITFVH